MFVRVVELCPWLLATGFAGHSVRVYTEMTGKSMERGRVVLDVRSRQRRLFRPDEVTSAALWLCSDGAAGVNGQGIVISGGEV